MILDGKALATSIRGELAETVREYGLKPCLAIVTVGDDPASAVYVRNKKKACEQIGIECRHISFPEDTTEYMVLSAVRNLCSDNEVHGVIVQLPLPKHINAANITSLIWRSKDVDGFGHDSLFAPCTPEGVIRLLDHYNIEIDGANAVVLGRSNIVGKPLAQMLLDRNATVSICHSHTSYEQRNDLTRNADIICCAVGEPGLLTPEDIKPGAVLVDVAINRDIEGKLCGDVNPTCYPYAYAYTPVPGGIGPMTVAMLMEHVVQSAIWQQEGLHA